MKKGLGSFFVIFAAVICFPITALAGDINSAEQGVIDAISSQQEYNGAYYKVTDAYIAKVTEYLSQDGIDMTQDEADTYLAQFYANIAVGVSAGYMEKTGDAEPQEASSEDMGGTGDTESDSENNSDQTIGSTVEGTMEYTVLPVDEETMYVYGVDVLEVHVEAYKDSDTLGSLAEGDAVVVTGAASTGWAQIKYNEETGYVSAVYLRTQGYMDNQEKDAEEEAVEETPKDYSDAEPIEKSLDLRMIALTIVVIFTIAIGGVILYHINKNKSKTRRR